MGSTLAVVDSEEKQNGIAAKLKARIHGLVCTGILKTLHVGCGLTRHDFVKTVVTGLQDNLTTIKKPKVAVRCFCTTENGLIKVV